jgi:peptidoglycan/LPS O-acetylase OafA/YrhL
MNNQSLAELSYAPTKLGSLASPNPTEAPAKYNHAIGYLRAFLVALVVAHHAALAYFPIPLPPPVSLHAQPRLWQAFPVLDAHSWRGIIVFAGFNDAFFMSLLFFLSGLFVWHSLARKGSARFLRDRLLRLGIPFVVAAAILAPLAYYPAYLRTTSHTGVAEYWHQWLALGQWPSGPVWFVWVLLTFDLIATLLFVIAPGWGVSVGRFVSGVSRRPAVFFAGLIAISAIAYIPMALIFTPTAWAAFGPFTFQTSRILHYLAYFLIGVGVGKCGVDHGLLAPDGKLAQRWPLWVLTALVLFAAASVVILVAFTSHARSWAWSVAEDTGFVLSCAASSFAFLALFVRFAQSRSRLFDSLSANSYGIYLVHYAFVSWLQYALLPASLPVVAKAAIVFLGALGLSWSVAAAIRQVPAVARLI